MREANDHNVVNPNIQNPKRQKKMTEDCSSQDNKDEDIGGKNTLKSTLDTEVEEGSPAEDLHASHRENCEQKYRNKSKGMKI